MKITFTNAILCIIQVGLAINIKTVNEDSTKGIKKSRKLLMLRPETVSV